MRVLDADASGRLRICSEPKQILRECTSRPARAASVDERRGRRRCCESLNTQGFQIPRAAIIEGIESAEHEGDWKWEEEPSLLRGAHNAAGARALRALWMNSFCPIIWSRGDAR